MTVSDLENARDLAAYAEASHEVEYVARAALLLRDLEWCSAGRCPVCQYVFEGGHSHQCDMAGALDTLEAMISRAESARSAVSASSVERT